MIRYYCTLIGRLCLKEECKQWKEKSLTCGFYKKIGEFLYQPLTGSAFKEIFEFLEEVRPTEKYND